MQLGDPDHDRKLRGHTGYHPGTMKHVAKNMPLDQLKAFAKGCGHWSEAQRQGDTKDLVIVAIRKKERHRSVSARELINTYLEGVSAKDVIIREGPRVWFPNHFCDEKRNICDACNHRGNTHIGVWKVAVNIFSVRMTEVHEYFVWKKRRPEDLKAVGGKKSLKNSERTRER